MMGEWVIGLATGEQAKHIEGLANEGVGYFVRRSEGKGASKTVEYAFLRPADQPCPHHLRVADAFETKKLEERRVGRMGLKPEQLDARR